MVDLSRIFDQVLAVLPVPRDGLLAASLALAFVSVFAAVLVGVLALRPDPRRRRLSGSGAPAGAVEPPPLRLGAAAMAAPWTRHSAALWPLARAAGTLLAFAVAVKAAEVTLSWVEGGVLAAALATFGALVPGRWRAWREARRREALRQGFPDALDMMVVCVEAGLGLDAALARVAAEIAPSHPPIAAALTQVVRELRAGKARDAVLRDFAGRTGLPELASFATLLIQSETLGTGIARTLRAQGEEMRAARMLRAEERAHTLPVKLTIPLVVCVLPAMIAVVLLPGMVALVRDILPNLGR